MDGKGRPKLKRFLCDVKEGIPFPSIWDNVGYNNTATAEIADFFGSVNIFDTPKPTSLLREILSLATNKKENSIILDFMAGSGTTGQAVLELNKEDGSNHQFILCTNNENNICSDVCYPRIEKAIRGYKNSKREKVEGLVGNLKYFKTDVVNAESTDKNKKKLTEQATEMLCIREGTFELVLEQNKMCLPPVDIEQGIESDNIFRTVDTEFGRLAMLSCKDAFYRYTNDLFQELRKAGVDLMLIPTWSLKVNQRSISLVREGVIAECNWSDIYVCLSGNVGNEIVNRIGKKLKAFGHAMIICPLRGVLKEGSEDREEILYETLEPKYLREIREYDKVWQPDERLEFRMEEP